MSGWMKYPYTECIYCERYDLEEDEEWAIVNHPYETCDSIHKDCPERWRRYGMKAITLWQPWAQLCVLGEKLVETRGYKTNVRGRVAIHAAKSDHSGILLHIPMRELAFFQQAGVCGIPGPPLGAVVGTVEIIDCLPLARLAGTKYDTPKERAFGDWSEGRWGWILQKPVLFERPIPAKGAQGFWNWEGEK